MEDIRKRLLIIIGLVSFTFIAVVLVILIVRGKEPSNLEKVEVKQENVDDIVNIEDPIKQAPSLEDMSPKNPEEVSAKQTARLFVERFQTYSNQNDNRHINDVLGLVTDSMIVWVKAQEVEKSLDYNGVTTKVLASSVSNLGDASATVNIEVYQTIENTEGVNIEQKSGRIELVKVGIDWKVNGFFWN